MNIDELRVYLNRKTGIEREPIIAFLKTEPTESLIHYLTDENSLIRNYSAEVLGEMRNKGVVPSLIKHLETGDEELQDKIIEALGKIGDSRAFQPILNLFLNGNLNFRGGIAWGELGDKRAIPFLLKGLQSKNPFLRTCAAYGLAKFKNTAVPDLIKCLRDKEPLVRGKALGILGKIWMENGFPGENVLNSIILQLNDETLWVREVTAEVLRLWGEAHSLIIFQKMKNLILSNVESITAPSTGNGIGEYATRIMQGIYKKHEGDTTLTGKFTAFLDQLWKLYEKNKPDTANALAYKKNLLQIMLYITSFLRLD
jgi:HEAT repeat protein